MSENSTFIPGFQAWFLATQMVGAKTALLRDSNSREARAYMSKRSANNEMRAINDGTKGGYYVVRAALYANGTPVLELPGERYIDLDAITIRPDGVYVTFKEGEI